MYNLSVNDTSRLITEIRVVTEMLEPEIDVQKLVSRMEELLGNYKIERKQKTDLSLDMDNKIELYVDAMRSSGFSELTIEGYERDLTIFKDFVSKPTSQVKVEDIRRYLSYIKENAITTRSKKLSILKSFFGWLVKEEEILRDPTLKIDDIKLPKRLPKALTLHELELARESCTSLRQRAIVEMLYSTGCRLDEITNIKRSQIDYHNSSIKVIGKGNKEREVFISPRCLYHLKKYLDSRDDDCPYLLVTLRRPYRQMGHRALQREVDKLNDYISINQNITPHVFRHTFANNLMNNGADLADVQELLGHSDPGTTLIYSRASKERKQSAFRKHHIM